MIGVFNLVEGGRLGNDVNATSVLKEFRHLCLMLDEPAVVILYLRYILLS